MKRSIWNLLPVLLCLAALLCLSAMAGTALGEGITLTLEGGTLTISGVGTVPSDVLTRLTEEERAHVTDVVIGEGITGIDGYALDPIGHQLRSIMIPASVTALGPNVLGTKGALDYTIYGDPETLRPLMSESNEDYGYFCTFMPAPSSMPDVPASAQVQGVVQEMGGLGVEMTLVKAAEASDNYGKCGMSWKKDIGFFERMPDMVFGLGTMRRARSRAGSLRSDRKTEYNSNWECPLSCGRSFPLARPAMASH